jgi:type IV pilus assembly protein PilV
MEAQVLTVHNRGFTLIELLISLVVVAIGLLGFASLQMGSMQRLEQAKVSQSASGALRDLVERISSLPTAAKAGEFDFNNLNNGVAPVASKDCGAVSCTTKEQADMELARWFARLEERAPSPRFSVVSVSQDDGRLVTISLVWDAHMTGQGAADAGTVTDSASMKTAHQRDNVEIYIP